MTSQLPTTSQFLAPIPDIPSSTTSQLPSTSQLLAPITDIPSSLPVPNSPPGDKPLSPIYPTIEEEGQDDSSTESEDEQVFHEAKSMPPPASNQRHQERIGQERMGSEMERRAHRRPFGLFSPAATARTASVSVGPRGYLALQTSQSESAPPGGGSQSDRGGSESAPPGRGSQSVNPQGEEVRAYWRPNTIEQSAGPPEGHPVHYSAVFNVYLDVNEKTNKKAKDPIIQDHERTYTRHSGWDFSFLET